MKEPFSRSWWLASFYHPPLLPGPLMEGVRADAKFVRLPPELLPLYDDVPDQEDSVNLEVEGPEKAEEEPAS